MEWIRFSENFDTSNGGALFIRNNQDGTYNAAGALWLDGGSEKGQHYFACVCEFIHNVEPYGLDKVVLSEFDAADAFNGAIDSDVIETIGWFDNMDAACEAVENRCKIDGIE